MITLAQHRSDTMESFDHLRIEQLISPYGPGEPPALPLDFGDYLSLLWRLERAGKRRIGLAYYRRCERSLAAALRLTDSEIGTLVRVTPPPKLSDELPNLPYRGGNRLVDAPDRKAAIAQLWKLRADVLTMGSYSESWRASWPGSGIEDEELRERVFAVLFTALPSQYAPFARVLLVTDIVLQELLIGTRRSRSFLLHELVREYGWPDPSHAETQTLFTAKD
jgi:hypothetical protein